MRPIKDLIGRQKDSQDGVGLDPRGWLLLKGCNHYIKNFGMPTTTKFGSRPLMSYVWHVE